MHLYLVRHGEAKNEKDDPERRLTEKGIDEAGKMARQAKRMYIRVSAIVHSPKVRASQTARMFAEQLRPEKGIDQSDNLLPTDDPGLWALRLAGMNEDVMLVGHLPYLSRLTSQLLTGDPDQVLIDLAPAGIVCLRREQQRWVLEWVVGPGTIPATRDSTA